MEKAKGIPVSAPVSDANPKHPVQGDRRITAISSVVTLRAYEVYERIYGKQEALITGWCRGGFGTGELIAFLYARTFPEAEWRARFDEAIQSIESKYV